MIELEITGWNPGLNKVSLTKLLQSEGGLSLGNAKSATDQLLSGTEVMIPLGTRERAEQLLASLTAIGAIARITVPTAVRKTG